MFEFQRDAGIIFLQHKKPGLFFIDPGQIYLKYNPNAWIRSNSKAPPVRLELTTIGLASSITFP
jgi:hypothetical protein